MLNLFAAAGLSVGITCILVSAISLLFGRSRMHRRLYFFNIAVALWGFGCFLAGIARTGTAAIPGWQLAHLGGFFVGPAFYHLATEFIGSGNRKLLFFGYAQATVSALLGFGTNLIFNKTRYVFDVFYIEAGPAYTLAVLLYLFFVLFSYYKLIQFYRTAKGYRRTQASYIIFGFLFGFVGATSTFLPMFRTDLLYPSGNFGIVVYAIVLSYAILRHRIIEFNLVVKKSVVYSLSVSLLTGLFVVLVFILTTYLSEVAGITSFTITVISALLIALLFSPLKNRVQLLVDKVFYRTTYDHYATVKEISHKLATTIELQRIFRLIVDTVFDSLRLKSAYLLSAVNGPFATAYSRTAQKEVPDVGVTATLPGGAGNLSELFLKQKGIIIKEELPAREAQAPEIARILQPFKGEVLVPIFVEDKLLFLLILGEKVSADAFSDEDISLFATIADQSSVALKNAMLYEELEMRVRQRTTALSRAIDNLSDEIRERRQAEEALRKSERNYRLLFENMTTGFALSEMIYNEQGQPVDHRYIEVNPAFEKLTGLPVSALLGRTIREVLPNTEQYWIDIAGNVAQTGIPFAFEHYSRQLNKHYDCRLFSPARDQFAVVFTDITERRQAAEELATYRGHLERLVEQRTQELAVLNAQLQQSQKMEAVGLLAGGIAHEFNNILTTIKGAMHLIAKKIHLDSPAMKYAEQIVTSVNKASSLSQDLLAFSRRQTITLRPTDFNGIIHMGTDLLSQLIGEHIELSITLTGGTPIVLADINRLEQVLLNLATNARDAMPDGGKLTICTEIVEMDEEFTKKHGYGISGRYVLLSVGDNGTGMGEEIKGKIYEPFFTTKETGKGSGLGLAVTYGIVRQHNGFIDVETEPGKGSTFKVYLPVVEEKPVLLENRRVSPAAGGRETILLAEDNADVRETISEVLRLSGYTVIETGDGETAVRAFAENRSRIDLVFLDVRMPKKNGREVYEEIKKMSPATAVLFMSGYTKDIIDSQGIIDEKLNFIAKPTMPEEILGKIREILDKQWQNTDSGKIRETI